MSAMYRAEILADSVGPTGTRLITWRLTFPRFLLAELNTHRMFSRNSASSRAIPPEKSIEQVRKAPFKPLKWGKRVKGMGQGEELEGEALRSVEVYWKDAADYAAASAQKLLDLGLNKSHVNRILEPFKVHTAIVTATDTDNFFELRCPPGMVPTEDFPAQMEFQQLAVLMQQTMWSSKPELLNAGEWHLPLIDDLDRGFVDEESILAQISAARCAKVSYETEDQDETHVRSVERCAKLAESGHWSPLEHPACATSSKNVYAGNFRDFVQLRKLHPGESGQWTTSS